MQTWIAERKLLLILHLIFWLGYVGFVSAIFAGFYPLKEALYQTFINLIFHLGLSYLNIFVLVPYWLEKKKFVAYGFIAVFILGGLIWLRTFLSTPTPMMPIVANLAFYRQRFVFIVSASFIFVFMMSLAYKMAEGWFQNLNAQTQLKNQQLEAELKFLRTQINPHFLFNTLNNIYTLTYLKDDKAPTMVMKLANLMRYLLYECQTEKVLLSKEIDFLKDYIALQKLKTDYTQNIEFNTQGIDNQQQIPSLLLLPLVENCFKHSNLDSDEKSWAKIDLQIIDNQELIFNISNSLKKVVPANSSTKYASGIGLENIRRRLTLFYPQKHHFEIKQSPDSFEVNLKLNLQT